MADVDDILALLCMQINLCTEINITPDHLQLAKYNKQNDDTMQSLWSVLNILSHCAVNKINPELNFQHYGEIKSTKLYFAYLGYCAVDFYELSMNCNNSRVLLLALGWLIATNDCFNIIICDKLIKSILGREFINSNNCSMEKLIVENIPSELLSDIHLLIHKCNRINNNLKEIAELIGERIRLIVKIHVATLNKNNLPYLNVSELNLMKKLFIQMKNNDNTLQVCENGFEELHNVGVLLEINTKWRKREEIFFNWMATVVDESKNKSITPSHANNDELSTIICIIRHLTKKKIHTIKLSNVEWPPEIINNNILKLSSCPTRLLRINNNNNSNNNPTNNNQTIMLQQLNEINSNIDKKMCKFNGQLKLLIKSIPNTLQI